jgi:hypothetical protein
MAKPPRSPILGYNHNVKYGGHVFHVQTEDSGPGNPHLFTHLFFEGSILASKRTQYDPDASEDEVRGMMQSQHKAILKELKHADYDERIARFFEMRGQTFRPDDFFADQTPEPGGAEVPPPEDKTPAMDGTLGQAAAAAAELVLDLDALPATSVQKAHTPEPLPIHVTNPAVPGPGTYTFRRPSREQLRSEAPMPPSIPARPRPGTRPMNAQPASPVVVQRQVVVGAGAAPAVAPPHKPATTTPVKRRPVSGGPYVVKEGSHASVAASVSDRRFDSPPRSAVSAAPPVAQPPAQASATETPAQEGAPTAFVTEQSLDDVILAYLSQGEGKR